MASRTFAELLWGLFPQPAPPALRERMDDEEELDEPEVEETEEDDDWGDEEEDEDDEEFDPDEEEPIDEEPIDEEPIDEEPIDEEAHAAEIEAILAEEEEDYEDEEDDEDYEDSWVDDDDDECFDAYEDDQYITPDTPVNRLPHEYQLLPALNGASLGCDCWRCQRYREEYRKQNPPIADDPKLWEAWPVSD